jgi:NADH:ubiquinone oxidoreductase subunit E
MSSDDQVVEIVVCLGSSCFARGNSEILAVLQQYVQNKGPSSSVRLAGCLCQDECKQGPNLKIDGEFHHNITAARLRELLLQLDESTRRSHGET